MTRNCQKSLWWVCIADRLLRRVFGKRAIALTFQLNTQVRKTSLILLNIVHFLLLGDASEEIFRAHPMMSKKLSPLTLSFWSKYNNSRFESTLLIHYSTLQVGL